MAPDTNKVNPLTTKATSSPVGTISTLWMWLLWMLGFGILSALFPRDVSFDVAHYQIHNGWAFFNDRYAIDLAPAEMHSFLNPIWQAFVWILIDNLPGRVVAFLLGMIQALMLPVVYLFTKKLFETIHTGVPKSVIIVIAMAGFLADVQFRMFASVRNDALGAMGFIFALTCLFSYQKQNRSQSLTDINFRSHAKLLFLASFVLGALAGMKPTNIIYVIGFAAAVFCVMPNWKDRLYGALVCGIAGLIGICLLGGPWAFHLWQVFGNPIFPLYNEIFQSPLGPEANFADQRYLPSGIVDGLIRPFKFLTNGTLINEYDFFDPRFQITYVSIFILIGLAVFPSRKLKYQTPRPVLAVSIALLFSILTWTYMFSIERYMGAAWLLGPSFLAYMLLIIWPNIFTQPRSFVLSLLACLCLNFITQLGQLRRITWENWSEPYVSADLPSRMNFEDSIILFSGPLPSAFLAPYFPRSALLSHASVAPWSAVALDHYRPVIDRLIWDGNRRVYAVIVDYETNFAAVLQDLKTENRLIGDEKTCQEIPTNFTNASSFTWKICPLTRARHLPDL